MFVRVLENKDIVLKENKEISFMKDNFLLRDFWQKILEFFVLYDFVYLSV